MKSLQKFLPQYSIALAVVFVVTVYFLITRGNTVDVAVVEVTHAELVQAIYATGFVEADAVANLSAECSGTVNYVGALEGQRVSAGQTIIRFDTPQPRLAVSEARAAFAEQQALAKDNRLRAARKRHLLLEGAISRQELEEAEKNNIQSEELLRQKELQVKIREDDLKKLTVTAPFSGILTLQSVKTGDYVTVNTLVARVVDTSRYLIGVEVDELDVPRIRQGQTAAVAFDAYPDKRFSAVVTRIVPQTDRVTKTSKIYLSLDHAPDNLQAGMTATANIIYNIRQNALLVKKTSLFEENRQSYLWKIEHGRLKKQPVRQGASDMTFVEVVEGLKKGDKIVPEPEKNFHEGMEARLIPAKKIP